MMPISDIEKRQTVEMHDCPLLNRRIYWGACYEVQDIRDDNMDMELFSETFSKEEANKVCEECLWYDVHKS